MKWHRSSRVFSWRAAKTIKCHEKVNNANNAKPGHIQYLYLFFSIDSIHKLYYINCQENKINYLANDDSVAFSKHSNIADLPNGQLSMDNTT